jgi:hypothetical protein
VTAADVRDNRLPSGGTDLAPRPRPVFPGRGTRRRGLAAWYGGFAGYSVTVALLAGGDDAVWGRWAAGGYALAAVLALCSRRPRLATIPALAGALAAPTARLMLTAPPTADIVAVTRAASLMLRHGSPYLPLTQLSSWRAYNPYLPAMALFGLPHAAGLPGPAGDPRLWLTTATVCAMGAALALTARHSPARCPACRRAVLHRTGFALASPLLALPLSLGITDPPVLALLLLALACAARAYRRGDGRWLAASGAALGAACAMKITAWPALPVLTVMFAAREGARVAARFAVAAAAATCALVVAAAPDLLTSTWSLLANTVLFPLGMTRQKTPAASPLPGHLLAATGPGHVAAIVLLGTAGMAVAVSLFVRPPREVGAAALRLAAGLALLFSLAPDARFGYFAYPAALLGWARTVSPRPTVAGRQSPRRRGWRGRAVARWRKRPACCGTGAPWR